MEVRQWLGLRTLTAEGLGSIPGQGTKIAQTVWCRPKNKTKPTWSVNLQRTTATVHKQINYIWSIKNFTFCWGVGLEVIRQKKSEKAPDNERRLTNTAYTQ